VWYHDKGDYTTAVFVNDYTDVAVFPRVFQALEVSLKMKRAGRGILVSQQATDYCSSPYTRSVSQLL
jgi:hypothetical protein